MAATPTLSKPLPFRNPAEPKSLTTSLADTLTQAPRSGVITLSGYGISVRVNRGHLCFEDGLGTTRRKAHFPRVGHGLRRLVVIGADGMISLAALRWLADQNAALVMLERDGKVLFTTGPVRSSDARLRRAQAVAHESGAALEIARGLIAEKLSGQEQVTRNRLCNCVAADAIARYRADLAESNDVDAVRLCESLAAAVYWAAWDGLPISFPKKDLPRVPDHWRVFKNRKSPLTGSPRLATNPANAMLNYLYAILESEARLSAAAMGLDPGLGFLHADAHARDSLACDLMEPIRPQVDAFVLDWIKCEPLKRDWFFEQRDGNCRLMSSFAVRLSETAPIWGRAVAPIAEAAARKLWLRTSHATWHPAPATRLTQSRKRIAKGSDPLPSSVAPRSENLCRGCGHSIPAGNSYCRTCSDEESKERMAGVAQLGRAVAQSAESQAKRSKTASHHNRARLDWNPSSLPDWLNREFYEETVQPKLATIPYRKLALSLGISLPYAVEIRSGRRLPHPRHWMTLAKLTGISKTELDL